MLKSILFFIRYAPIQLVNSDSFNATIDHSTVLFPLVFKFTTFKYYSLSVPLLGLFISAPSASTAHLHPALRQRLATARTIG